MNIAIIGTGYVGLVSGVCLASKGHRVTCVDVRKDVVENLNKGLLHIYEENLEQLLHQSIKNNCFKATTNFDEALDESNIVILAVGTPSENGKIDLSQIKIASAQIGQYIKKSNKFISIVVKSTVIPTTTDTTIRDIIENTSDKKLGDFGLGMNPEFLREGEAVNDFINPDRIVIGYEDEKTKQYLEEIYSPWDCDKVYTNTRTAEMIKYTNNTLLACLISINNELANLASEIGNIDYNDIIKGVITDKRWSPIKDNTRLIPSISTYFTPGAGFGGSCFPKDVQAIRTQGEELGLDMSITNAILNINDNQPNQVINILKKQFNIIDNKKALLLGLTFKPGTDDIRESSSLKILNLLLDNNVKVIAHDPIAIEYVKKQYNHSNLQFVDIWQNELGNVDVIIIGTNWAEYKILKNYLSLLRSKNITIFDTKRLFEIKEMDGINYLTFGYFKNKE